VLQYSGYYHSNPHKICVLSVKIPYAFHEFQTPSCPSTELPASSGNRLNNFLRKHTTRPSPHVYHCKIQGLYTDQSALLKRFCGDNVCLQAASVVFLCYNIQAITTQIHAIYVFWLQTATFRSLPQHFFGNRVQYWAVETYYATDRGNIYKMHQYIRHSCQTGH